MTPPPNRGPMPSPGDPTSQACRHCGEPKLIVRGFLFCEKCDAPQGDGITIRPTWKPRLKP